MAVATCPDCEKMFSRRDVMLRHRRNKHSIPPPLQAHPPPQVHWPLQAHPLMPPPQAHPLPPSPPPQIHQPLQAHPLTPPQVHPPPPLRQANPPLQAHPPPPPPPPPPPSQVHLGEQLPQLTFVKGIPYDILDEDYFDARQQNVLVLDDFLAEAKHDKRISRLFTQTSHHKNVLIFLLIQNLFPRGKESRDIALNGHYVTLFHSPIDKQQIKLFARRIFPEHMDHFMAMYEKVAETPYGQLTIDLKPTTKDKDRLHVNLINEENRRTTAQSEPDLRREKLTTTESSDSPLTREERLPQHQLTPIETNSNTSSETSLTMATACADCRVLIDNLHDLQRHIKHWCPANSLQPNRKRARLESHDDDSDFDDLASSQKGSGLAVKAPRGKSTFTNMEAEEWQNVGLHCIWKQVYDTFHDKMKLQKKQYERQGRTQEWIERRLKLRWEDLVRSTLNYAMEYTTYFKEAPLFQNMLYNLGDMNPSTEQSVLKNKIKLLLKPKMKEILPLIDMPEIESETESDSVEEDNNGEDEEEEDDREQND